MNIKMSKRETEKRRKVYIKVSFLKIEDINEVNGKFTAEVYFQARWRELSLDHSKVIKSMKQVVIAIIAQQKNSEIRWESYWNPNIFLDNVVSEKDHIKWNVLKADEKGAAYIIEKHRLRGTFFKEMKLEMYPFDIQPLSLLVGTKLSTDDLDLLEEHINLSNVHAETFPKYHEWELKASTDFVSATSADDIFSISKSPNLEVTCFARRRSGFFFWNVFLIMTLNTLLSFTIFTVDRRLPDFRIRLGFILLLSGVTFKFTISRFIPGIPYLTQLDKYVIGNSLFVAMTCVWHAVVTLNIDGISFGEEEDKWALVAFAATYVLLQIIYILNVIISGYENWSHVKRLERAYKKKAESSVGNEKGLSEGKGLKRKITQNKYRAWNKN